MQQNLENAQDRAKKALSKITDSKIIPCLHSDCTEEQIDSICLNLLANNIKILGFNPQKISPESLEILLNSRQVRNGDVSLIPSVVRSVEELEAFVRKGIKTVFYVGQLEALDSSILSKLDLLIPIVNFKHEISDKVCWLSSNKYPLVIKTFIQNSEQIPQSPDELGQLIKDYPDCKFIHFGSVDYDNIQEYLNQGALALGITRMLPVEMIADDCSLSGHMQRFSAVANGENKIFQLSILPDASAVQIFHQVQNLSPELKSTLDLTAKISEGWTVAEHTILALSNADRFGIMETIEAGKKSGRWSISAQSFVKCFALHDCGKFIPGVDDKIALQMKEARESGDLKVAQEFRDQYQSRQHKRVAEYFLPKYQTALGVGDQERLLMTELIAGDEIGNLFVRSVKGRPNYDSIVGLWKNMPEEEIDSPYHQKYIATVRDWEKYWQHNVIPEQEEQLALEAAVSIKTKADKLNMKPEDLLDLKLLYALLDMSAYTLSAYDPILKLRGKPVLDHYFARANEPKDTVFDIDFEKGRMKLSETLEAKIDLVRKILQA